MINVFIFMFVFSDNLFTDTCTYSLFGGVDRTQTHDCRVHPDMCPADHPGQGGHSPLGCLTTTHQHHSSSPVIDT